MDARTGLVGWQAERGEAGDIPRVTHEACEGWKRDLSQFLDFET